jgi:hypothetical protein
VRLADESECTAKVLHAALLTGLLYAIVLYSFNLVVDRACLAGEVFLPSVVGAFFLVNMGLAFFIVRRVMFQSRSDVRLFGFVSALVVIVGFFLALRTSPVQTLTDDYGESAVYGIAGESQGFPTFCQRNDATSLFLKAYEPIQKTRENCRFARVSD